MKTMSEYLVARRKCIAWCLKEFKNDGKRFTRKEFEMKVLDYCEIFRVDLITPEGNNLNGVTGGWHFVSFDRVHNALQSLVRSGHLTFKNVDGYFVYSITSLVTPEYLQERI